MTKDILKDKTVCKKCGRNNATVKQIIGEDGYRVHCPDCGSVYRYIKLSKPSVATVSTPNKTTLIEKVKAASSAVTQKVSNTKKEKKQELPRNEKKKGPRKMEWTASQVPSSNATKVNRTPSESIIIHLYKSSEIADIEVNAAKIRREYPEILPEKMTLNSLIQKVFPSKLSQKCVIKNQSYSEIGDDGEPFIVPRVELYCPNHSYLKGKLETNQQLVFSGKVKSGRFFIDDLRVVDNPVIKEDDIQITAVFYTGTDGDKKSNYLKEVTKELPRGREQRLNAIGAWREYLDWKNQLAELRIQALKYIAFDVDVSDGIMSFLVCYEDESQLKAVGKYLRRNEVSVFSNQYSTDRFQFKFNPNDASSAEADTGLALAFVDKSKAFSFDSVNEERWDRLRAFARKYKDSSVEYDSVSDVLRAIQNSSTTEYQLTELRFSLSDHAISIIQQSLRQYGTIVDGIEEQIAGDFYPDGFVATSHIGDFSLIRRLKRGIEDFISGKSVSQGLDQWLFDISKARSIDKISHIKRWQNKKLNDSQKLAVERIVSAPDVCLVQGPPGTGKTTVIAESIYQFVLQHKRVLVASQANLAVDNALERLIQNPKIRAIRLGNSRKLSDSVSNITEENVLANFYSVLIKYVENEYESRWIQYEETKHILESDFEDAKRIESDISGNLILRNEVLEASDREIKKFDFEAVERIISAYSAKSLALDNVVSFCEGTPISYSFEEEPELASRLLEKTAALESSFRKEGLLVSAYQLDSDSSDISETGSVHSPQKCKSLVEGLILAIALQKKFTNSSMAQLLSLRMKEKELMSLLEEDDAVLDEWRSVKRQIKSLESEGDTLTLSEAEELLFSQEIRQIEDSSSRHSMMSTTLDSCYRGLIEMQSIVLESLREKQLDYSGRIASLNERKNEVEQLRKESNEKIAYLDQELSVSKAELEDLRNKHELPADGEVSSGIFELIQNLDGHLKGIRKEDWEPVFTGFKEWVANIPDYESERKEFVKPFINGCNVVGVSCTENTRTLKDGGFDDFDVVIIDEVSKATPPELLIPMLKGKKIVLVGDHRQLPPLFNEHESSYQEVVNMQAEYSDLTVELKPEDFEKYKKMVTSSLFEEYFEYADSSIKQTLTDQYRMHSDIMDLVNFFYDGQLRDGNSLSKRAASREHGLTIESTIGADMIVPAKHAYWIDSSEISGMRVYEHREEGSKSAANIVEAHIILELLRKMEIQYANLNDGKDVGPVTVGVISFYYEQVVLLRKMLHEESFHAIDVEINTVDRFQGKEKEIILVSLVRNTPKIRHSANSFVAAYQRINVAFSRAQNLLVIVGARNMYADQTVLISGMQDGTEKEVFVYRDIIEHLNMKGAYYSADDVIPEQTARKVLESYLKDYRGQQK